MNLLAQLAAPDTTRKTLLLDALRQRGSYKILLAILKDTQVDGFLRRPGPFTFLAPTDEAFGKYPNLADLLSDTQQLRSTLYRHICAGRFDFKSLGGVNKLQSVEVETQDKRGRDMLIQDARVVEPDIRAWNGIAHGIDKVLVRENHIWVHDAGISMERLKNGSDRGSEWINSETERLERAIVRSMKR